MNIMYKLATIQSTYISSATPYSSFAGSTIVKAGNDISRVPTREYMTLLQFDVSQIPLSRRIVSAYLVLNAQSISGEDTTKFLLSRLNEAFDEGVATWNNYSSISKTVISNLIINELMLIAEVTELVKSWVDIPVLNYGIAVSPLDSNSDIMASMYSGILENGNDAPIIIVEYSDEDSEDIDMDGVFVQRTQSDDLCTFGIHNYRAQHYSAKQDYKNIISVVQSKEEKLARNKIVPQEIMMNEEGVFVPAGQSASISTDSLKGAKELAVIGNKAPKLVSFISKTSGGSYNLNDNIFVKTTLETLIAPINKPQVYTALNYQFTAPTGSTITTDKNGMITVPVNSAGGKAIAKYNVMGVDTEMIEFENDVQVYTSVPANLDVEFEEPGTAIFTNLVEDTLMVISSGNVLTIGTKYLNFYSDTSDDYKADIMFIASQALTNVTAKVERSVNEGASYTTIVSDVDLSALGQQFFLNEIVKGTLPSLVSLASVNEIYRVTFTTTITEVMELRITSFNVAGKLKASSDPQVIDEANMKYLNQNANGTLRL